MATIEPNTLQSFHRFLGKQLETDPALPLSPEEAIALWREEQKTLSAIREGLADIEAGRSIPLVEFERDLRQRFGLEGSG